jgi:SAM-dependent methyltransferase
MAIAPEWWRTFFSGPMVEMWLQATTEEQTRREADFIQRILQAAPPAKLLDAPCGGGRHAVELAARGYALTAVDISADFLTAARARAAERGREVCWEQRDMRDLPWQQEFDGAYCFGNSFGYYEGEGNAEFLKAVARTLKPGGRFVLETGYMLETLLPAFQPRVWAPLGQGFLLWDRRYDPIRSRLEVEYTVIRDGRVERWPMAARLHSCAELARLLAEAGFGELAWYGSVAGEPFQFGSKIVLVSATRMKLPMTEMK